LARREASLASWVVSATPTEQVTRCSSKIRIRRYSPIWAGDPNRRSDPDTSRKASSIDNVSTLGVMLRNVSITADDTWATSS
jgi:hypothetical protein